ncbi:hypothetical protein QNH23_13045 [Siminovitchia fortis]|uniref:Uncharacterized protein n=1 Tax=Siminovitchia fortis TaxID=254758 RepID=A0A443IML5_9BACI|nr:hypothetical protein [Siminovitchia fortis]RWR06533.1 hypothetical protein D4N35_014135 [Siminovitchia fortis]WHY80839.1 hypothetical protein QNH23_13045 [Siminovitchia fortis]
MAERSARERFTVFSIISRTVNAVGFGDSPFNLLKKTKEHVRVHKIGMMPKGFLSILFFS